MKLTVIESSSKGNGYILHNGREALIIEAGVKIGLVKIVLNFEMNLVVGCIVSHEHGDHAGHAHEYQDQGIKVYTSAGTRDKIHKPGAAYKLMQEGEVYTIGRFHVLPFRTYHDAAEPFGFLISHPDMGTLAFLADTASLPYDLDADHYLIEANYSERILDRLIETGKINYKQATRVRHSHLSIEACAAFLARQKREIIKNIVLIHLSDGNSDAARFAEIVRDETGIANVFIADKKFEIPINKNPF